MCDWSQISQYECTVDMLVIVPHHPAGMSASGCWNRDGKDCKASLDMMFAEKCPFFKTRKEKARTHARCTFPFAAQNQLLSVLSTGAKVQLFSGLLQTRLSFVRL